MNHFLTSLPMILNRTYEAIIPRYREAFKAHNITEQQWRILRVLWETDECTTSELAQKTLLPPPSMVGVIDRMVKKNLVNRQRSDIDRRRIFIMLTPSGSAMQDELAPIIEEIHQSIAQGCDEQSWQIMMNVLEQVTDNAKQSKPSQAQTSNTVSIEAN